MTESPFYIGEVIMKSPRDLHLEEIPPSKTKELLSEENGEIRTIRQKLLRMMDGTTASSLREKGVQYDYLLGLSIPHLRQIALDIPKDALLAETLLKSGMRELKLLGLMLFPHKGFSPDRLHALIEACNTRELEDHLAYHLVAEAENFEELMESLTTEKESRKNLRIAFVAASRRLLLQKPFSPSVLKKLLTSIEGDELSSESVNFLFHLAKSNRLASVLGHFFVHWKSSERFELRELAEELQIIMRETCHKEQP